MSEGSLRQRAPKLQKPRLTGQGTTNPNPSPEKYPPLTKRGYRRRFLSSTTTGTLIALTDYCSIRVKPSLPRYRYSRGTVFTPFGVMPGTIFLISDIRRHFSTKFSK